jgi:hypothetical protein
VCTENQPYRHMQHTTRVLRLRLKDKYAPELREKACEVNFLWNYCKEFSMRVWEPARRLLSGYDFHSFTKGAGKAGLGCSLDHHLDGRSGICCASTAGPQVETALAEVD